MSVVRPHGRSVADGTEAPWAGRQDHEDERRHQAEVP